MDEPFLIQRPTRVDAQSSGTRDDSEEQNHKQQEKLIQEELITLAMPLHLASGHVKALRNLTKQRGLVPISGLGWASLGEINDVFTDHAYPSDQNQSEAASETALGGKVSHIVPVLGPLVAQAVDAAAHIAATGESSQVAWGKHYLQCVFEFLKHSAPSLRDTAADWLKAKLGAGADEPEGIHETSDRIDAMRWKLVQKEYSPQHQSSYPKTVEDFLKLSPDEQADMLFYIETAQSIHVTREQKSNFTDALKHLHAGDKNSVITICIQELLALYALVSPREKQKITPADCKVMDAHDTLKALQLIREHDKLLRPDERLTLSRFAAVTSKKAIQRLSSDDLSRVHQFLVHAFNKLPGEAQSRLNSLSAEQIEELPPSERHIVCNLAAAKVVEKGSAAEKVRFEQLQAKNDAQDYKSIALSLEKYLTAVEKAVLISSLQARFAVMQLLPEELDQMIVQIEKNLKGYSGSPQNSEIATLKSQLELLRSYQRPNVRRPNVRGPKVLQNRSDKSEMLLARKNELLELLCRCGLPNQEAEAWVQQLGVKPQGVRAAPKSLQKGLQSGQHPLLALIEQGALDAKQKAIQRASGWADWVSHRDQLSDWIEMAGEASAANAKLKAARSAKQTLQLYLERSAPLVGQMPSDCSALDALLDHSQASKAYYEQALFHRHPVASWLFVHSERLPCLKFIVKNINESTLTLLAQNECARLSRALETAERRIAKLSTNHAYPLAEILQAYVQEHAELEQTLESKKAVKASMEETKLAKKEVLERLEREIIQTENGLKIVYFNIQELEQKQKKVADTLARLQERKTTWHHILHALHTLIGKPSDSVAGALTPNGEEPIIEAVRGIVQEALQTILFAKLEEQLSSPVQFQRHVRIILERLDSVIADQKRHLSKAAQEIALLQMFVKVKENCIQHIESLEQIEQQNVERAKEKLALLAERSTVRTGQYYNR